METDQKVDVLGFRSIIEEALPKAMVKYSDNFDDYYHGWDICPQPGVLIRFCINQINVMHINITKYVTNTFIGTYQMQRMYFGDVPPNDNREPDFGFVKQLLKNWEAIA